MQPVPLVVGVTGHRDLLDEELPLLRTAIETFLADLRERWPHTPICLMTALADGADRLAAEVANQAGIETTILLPMPRDLYELDFDTESKQVFDEMMGYGDCIELPLLPDIVPADVTRPGHARDAQYEYLGIYLAAHCHILLAVWDGKHSHAVGGTAQVIRFHQEDIVEVIPGEAPRWSIDFAEDESDLVFHVACSRQDSGPPAQELMPGATGWLTRDSVLPRTDEMPARYGTVLQRLEEFNIDLRQNNEPSADTLLADESLPMHPALAAIRSLFQIADAQAIRFQRSATRTIRAFHGFAALTGLSFIAYADFPDADAMIFVYLFSIVSLTLLFARDRRSQHFRKYLDYRVLAEGLRVQFYWALSGVQMRHPTIFPHDCYMKRQDLELGWIRNVMRYAAQHSDSLQPANTAEPVDAAIQAWIGDEHQGQTGYYRARSAQRHKRSRQTTVIGLSFAALTLIIALVLATSAAVVEGSIENVLIALVGGLPFLAAVRQSYAHRTAEKELIAQYGYMARVFTAAHGMLNRQLNVEEKREVLRAVGEAALDEHALWILRQRERPISGESLVQAG